MKQRKGKIGAWRVCPTTNASLVQISVSSWNILSPTLLKDTLSLYKKHKETSDLLNWNKRRLRILKMLLKTKSDVMCVQELDVQDYEYFKVKFGQIGYTSCYKKRTGKQMDGVAVFVKGKIASSHPVEYKQNSFMDRDNVGLIAICEIKGFKVVIATTHILFNQKRGFIKLAQIHHLLHTAHQVGKDLPIILAGDFNIAADSTLYKFITQGYLHLHTHLNEANLSGQLPDKSANQEEKYLGLPKLDLVKNPLTRAPINKRIQHPYNFENAMHLGNGVSPYFTVNVNRHGIQPDFIFFGEGAKQKFETIQYVEPMTHENMELLPNNQHPSDHLCLTVKLALVEKRLLNHVEQNDGHDHQTESNEAPH
jgi:protein angel